MKIYHNIDEFHKLDYAIVTIGTFDGVHLGHQKIISRLEKLAKQNEAETVVLTFFPHPRMILHPEDENIRLITTMAEKAALLDKLGVDHLIITPFTRDFSNLSPEEYIKNILVDQIGMKHIVIGYDHRFGKNREGGLTDLQQMGPRYGFKIEEILQQDIHSVAVSSTKIRQALLRGDVETAREFLGYPFTLMGKVIKGDQIGRKMGFPTANLFVEEKYKLIPSDGIYAVEIELSENSSKKYRGMAYIGNRPTINGMARNIEVNIFDFDQDIYNQCICMHFIRFVRADQKFNSLEELRVQLIEDERITRAMFK